VDGDDGGANTMDEKAVSNATKVKCLRWVMYAYFLQSRSN